MTLEIEWLDIRHGAEEIFTVPTQAGDLVIYHQQGLITKTDWTFEAVMNPVENALSYAIQEYINVVSKQLRVQLSIQGSGFRQKVWKEIAKVPPGQVVSYGRLADKVGSGARAVANACRDNPFPGLIPCHRVVSATGLGGYNGETSGPQLDIKKKLLQIEADKYNQSDV